MAVIDNNPHGAYEEFEYWLRRLPLWRMGVFAGIAGILFRIIGFKLVSALFMRVMLLILAAKLCAWILSKPSNSASRFCAACLCIAIELSVVSNFILALDGTVPAISVVVMVIGWVIICALFAMVIGILVRIFIAMFLS